MQMIYRYIREKNNGEDYMKKGCIFIGIAVALMIISCSKTGRPDTPGQRGPIQEMNIGVDVPLETAKKQLIGKWNLVRI